jgi:hypothetical protein
MDFISVLITKPDINNAFLTGTSFVTLTRSCPEHESSSLGGALEGYIRVERLCWAYLLFTLISDYICIFLLAFKAD